MNTVVAVFYFWYVPGGRRCCNSGLGGGAQHVSGTLPSFSPYYTRACMCVSINSESSPSLPITVSRCIHCGVEIACEPLTNDRCSSDECILGTDDPPSTLEWLQFQTPIISWGNEHQILRCPPPAPSHNHSPVCCLVKQSSSHSSTIRY